MIGPFDADDDATPLTAEERNGLIPTHIALRSELNELEQSNIAEVPARLQLREASLTTTFRPESAADF